MITKNGEKIPSKLNQTIEEVVLTYTPIFMSEYLSTSKEL